MADPKETPCSGNEPTNRERTSTRNVMHVQMCVSVHMCVRTCVCVSGCVRVFAWYIAQSLSRLSMAKTKTHGAHPTKKTGCINH